MGLMIDLELLLLVFAISEWGLNHVLSTTEVVRTKVCFVMGKS